MSDMIVLMEEIFIYITLVVFGAGFGSFAGAQVWRLRARQLEDDKREGEKVNAKEYKRLSPLINEKSLTTDRSCCLSCGKVLAWYDLIPLLSWLSTGGKCRYCKKQIGKFELLMEIGVAGAFALSYALWPAELDNLVSLVSFGLWLAAIVALAILFAYDLKWYLLPDVVTFPLIGIGVVFSALQLIAEPNAMHWAIHLGGSIMMLSGLYYLLWRVSDGKWVGFGDVKLGLALALFLVDWRLALLTLFAANFIGSLVVMPGMISGKIGRKASVPFGPFLITGFVIAMLIGDRIIEAYLGVSF